MDELGAQMVAGLPPDLQEGSADHFSIAVSALRLTDGNILSPPMPGITAIVGPNNAGKSTLLREVHSALNREPYQALAASRVISAVDLVRSGEPADLVAWLLQHGRVGRVAGGTSPGLASLNSSQQVSSEWLSLNFRNYWPGIAEGRLGGILTPFFVHYADTATRLDQSHAAPVREDARSAAIHPLHALEDDRQRLRVAKEMAEDVFQVSLYLDDYSAARRLRVGDLTVPAPTRGEEDRDYRDALLNMAELSEQGDGMRSFFGQLLPLLARTYPLILVDEPEAFLHPPQAARLGRALGDLVDSNGVQLILATHDRHLLSGLLQSSVELSVVRIDRNRPALARQLSAVKLRKIWADPAVRYSNALDGLFHRLVVLVEGDGDARFYAAALDAANDAGSLQIPPPDVLFVPCNGKGGMAKLAEALVELGVPVVASPDIDIIRSSGQLRALVEALGGAWAEFSDHRCAAVANLTRNESPLRVSDLISVLPEDRTAPLDSEVKNVVERLLRTVNSGWDSVKRAGLAALGGTMAGVAAAKLFDDLDNIGLVAVREGELESFDHTMGALKNRWVAAAIDAGVHRRAGPVAHVTRLIAAGSVHRGTSGGPAPEGDGVAPSSTSQ